MTNELETIHTVLKRKLNHAILNGLRDGPLRYSQLLHAVSRESPTIVHPKTLTRTLEHLQDQGLVEHHRDAEAADYRLTTAGTNLIDLVIELSRWTREHGPQDDDEDQGEDKDQGEDEDE